MRSKSAIFSEITLFFLIAAAWLIFATATARLEKIQQPKVAAEMQIALPRFMQVILTGGDRFLATNISVFRALTVSTDNKQANRYVIQSVIQNDAAWLNPRNEDNYYLATAILSWNGQVNTAQHILKLATESRPFDMLPPFYYAFNEYYFRHDPILGAEWLKIAAMHSDSEQDRIGLQRIASHWAEKGQDRHDALKLVEGMAAQSRYASLRRQLLLRAERIRQLITLDEAVNKYNSRFHRQPATLEALVTSNILSQLPQDPMGEGYILDAQGKPQIRPTEKK